jgi:hypothetical protein
MEQDFLEYWCNTNSIKLYIKTIVNLKRKNSKRSDYEYESKKIRFDFLGSFLTSALSEGAHPWTSPTA